MHVTVRQVTCSLPILRLCLENYSWTKKNCGWRNYFLDWALVKSLLIAEIVWVACRALNYTARFTGRCYSGLCQVSLVHLCLHLLHSTCYRLPSLRYIMALLNFVDGVHYFSMPTHILRKDISEFTIIWWPTLWTVTIHSEA